jgi:hypothetical protein
MTEIPKGFADIDPDVLRRQAVEDWAIEVKPADSLKKVLKAFDDAGVEWEDYADRYGYSGPQVNTLDEPDSVASIDLPAAGTSVVDPTARTPERTREGAVVTSAAMGIEPSRPIVAAEPVVPRTAEPLVVEGPAPFLVKMERPNVRYTYGRYVWTQDHPYALVAPEDFERVLKHEPGFRQAYPSELQEFYR